MATNYISHKMVGISIVKKNFSLSYLIIDIFKQLAYNLIKYKNWQINIPFVQINITIKHVCSGKNTPQGHKKFVPVKKLMGLNSCSNCQANNV